MPASRAGALLIHSPAGGDDPVALGRKLPHKLGANTPAATHYDNRLQGTRGRGGGTCGGHGAAAAAISGGGAQGNSRAL